MPKRLVLSLVAAVAACGGVDTPAGPDAATTPDAASPDASPDANPDAAPASCDVSMIPAYQPVDVIETMVRPSDTAVGGEVINDVLNGQLKRHMLIAPTTGPRPTKAFLWLSGSGAEPFQYRQYMNVAASMGYVAISLAYDNEISINALCNQATPACNDRMNLDCSDQVRREIIYGSDLAPNECVDVPTADSIKHRVVRLVQYIDRQFPNLGARQFLDASGQDLAWDKWAVGGWSQGGGHAGVLAGDHRVDRAVYMSKGSDSVLCALTTSDPNRDCDLDGDGMLDPMNLDEMQVPAPAAFRPRLTPGQRQFGFIHELEGAWNYSRETFEAFGMGARGDEVRLDGLGPYPAAYADFGCANVFSIVAPAGGADPDNYHLSMAIDAALARGPDGLPILAHGLAYALAVPVE